MHPLRKSSFRFVERLESSDVLSACPSRLACRCATFPTKFQFKFREAGQYAGHYAACGVSPATRRSGARTTFSALAALCCVGSAGNWQISALEVLAEEEFR